jgi:hypothetical protein
MSLHLRFCTSQFPHVLHNKFVRMEQSQAIVLVAIQAALVSQLRTNSIEGIYAIASPNSYSSGRNSGALMGAISLLHVSFLSSARSLNKGPYLASLVIV